MTYRNDGEGPAVGSGRSELGSAEVADVRAAVHFAVDNGARSVVLFGWSMGAAIALQLAAEPEFERLINGLLLESPVLGWVATIRANCSRAGLPPWVGLLVIPWLSNRPLAGGMGLSDAVKLSKFDWIARANQLSLPVIIFHGIFDTSSPISVSVQLKELRPDKVDLYEFVADHTTSWNSDPERWRTIASSWLVSVVVVPFNNASAARV